MDFSVSVSVSVSALPLSLIYIPDQTSLMSTSALSAMHACLCNIRVHSSLPLARREMIGGRVEPWLNSSRLNPKCTTIFQLGGWIHNLRTYLPFLRILHVKLPDRPPLPSMLWVFTCQRQRAVRSNCPKLMHPPETHIPWDPGKANGAGKQASVTFHIKTCSHHEFTIHFHIHIHIRDHDLDP